MYKSSILYRRLWYYRNRNAKRIRTYVCLLSIFIILALFISYAEKKFLPYLFEISELKARSAVSTALNEAVEQAFSEEITYEKLATVSKDSKGDIVSIETNMVRINRLTAQITEYMQQKLASIKNQTIKVPLGALSGNTLLSSLGPDIHIQMMPVGNVETTFRSEFYGSGVNQTRHRIFLDVRSTISVIFPMVNKRIELLTSMPVAETILVGRMPDNVVNMSE